MGPTPFGNLVPSLGLDSGDRFVTPGQQSEPPQVSKGDLKGLAGVAILSKLGSTGEAEKSGGLEQGGQGIGVESRVARERDQKPFGVRTPLHGGPFL